MEQSSSMGHKYMAQVQSTGFQEARHTERRSERRSERHARRSKGPHGKAQPIQDPAFTRRNRRDRRAAPAMEEVQVLPEDVAEESAGVNDVVEENNGANWPDA